MSEKIKLNTDGQERANKIVLQQLGFDLNHPPEAIASISLPETLATLKKLSDEAGKPLSKIPIAGNQSIVFRAKEKVQNIIRNQGGNIRSTAVDLRARGAHSLGTPHYIEIFKDELLLVTNYWRESVTKDQFVAAYQQQRSEKANAEQETEWLQIIDQNKKIVIPKIAGAALVLGKPPASTTARTIYDLFSKQDSSDLHQRAQKAGIMLGIAITNNVESFVKHFSFSQKPSRKDWRRKAGAGILMGLAYKSITEEKSIEDVVNEAIAAGHVKQVEKKSWVDRTSEEKDNPQIGG